MNKENYSEMTLKSSETVEIPLSDYERILRNETITEMLIRAIFNNASLSTAKTNLYISGTELESAIRLLFPAQYSYKLKELRDAEERNTAKEGFKNV